MQIERRRVTSPMSKWVEMNDEMRNDLQLNLRYESPEIHLDLAKQNHHTWSPIDGPAPSYQPAPLLLALGFTGLQARVSWLPMRVRDHGSAPDTPKRPRSPNLRPSTMFGVAGWGGVGLFVPFLHSFAWIPNPSVLVSPCFQPWAAPWKCWKPFVPQVLFN